MKPVLFVTSHAPSYRWGAFQRLHEREDVEFAIFGGRLKHGGAVPSDAPPFPHRMVRERDVYGLARSGRYRAVVCSTGGRLALLGAWAGARRARVPLVLWASLWAHPLTPAHLLSFLPLRRLYRSADAVVAYGEHVRAYVRARGARNVHLAPQSVDNDFWSSRAPAPTEARRPLAGDAPSSSGNAPSSCGAPPSSSGDPPWPVDAQVKFLFAGRPAREKGLGVLIEAWISSGLRAPTAALVLVGVGSTPPWVPAGGAVCLDAVAPEQLRNLYSAADVLVLPSIRTRTFREPWGLVVNEAMNQGLAVIATDAVGAAAGGLVRDGRNGIVVPAGDSEALASAMRRLANDPHLAARMGEAGREDVKRYTHDAWASGFSQALASVNISRERW